MQKKHQTHQLSRNRRFTGVYVCVSMCVYLTSVHFVYGAVLATSNSENTL